MSKNRSAVRPIKIKAAAISATTDYVSVGYKRPPKHSRFKAGASGNPRGRPKNTRNLKSMIRDVLIKPVTVRQGATKTSMSALEGLLHAQLKNGLNGNGQSTFAILRLAAQLGLLDGAESETKAQPLTDAEQEILAELLSQNSKQSNPSV